MISLRGSSTQVVEQPSLIAVKDVTWGLPLQVMTVRMGIKPCEQRRSAKTRKNYGAGFDGNRSADCVSPSFLGGEHGRWVGGFALKGSASGRQKRPNGAGADDEGRNPNEPWPALAPHRAANGGLDLGALGGVALPEHRTG